MLVSQTLRWIPNQVRLAASHVLCFEPANRLEAGVLASEFICLDPKSAGELFKQCFREKHDHMLIHVGERHVYSNFNEVEIPPLVAGSATTIILNCFVCHLEVAGRTPEVVGRTPASSDLRPTCGYAVT